MNKRYTYASGAVLFLMLAIAAATASSTAPSIMNRAYQILEGESLVISTSLLEGKSKGLNAISASQSGSACTCTSSSSPIDIHQNMPLVRMNDHTRNNYAYQAEIKEVSASSVGSGIKFKIELFMNNVSVGAIYIDNSDPKSTQVEGVIASYDVGTSNPQYTNQMFEYKVTQV